MAFGSLAVVADATAGGKTLDSFTPPLVVTGARSWGVTKLNFDRGSANLDRGDEMRGTRSSVADLSYRQAPSVTAGGFIYGPMLKTLLFQALGVASSSGSGLTGYTHALSPVLDATQYGPAMALAFKRDTESVSRNLIGAKLNELTLTFPETGQATWDGTWVGNYIDEAGTAPPTPDFAYLGSPELMLTARDGKLFEAGSGTATAAVKAFTVKIGPLYEDADYDWGANVANLTVDSVVSPVQFPSGSVLKGMREITGSVTYRGLDPTRDLRAVLARTRQFRVDFAGRAIAGSTGPVSELCRLDFANLALSGPENPEITRGNRPDTTINWKAASTGAVADMTASILDGVAGPVTVAN